MSILKCIQNLVKFCPFVLKILSGHKILTIFKGHNSLINLQKLMHYNPKLDLVSIKVYTKFGHILSICSQDIERKQILCYNPHLDLVNIKVYTKFGQILSICSQDIEQKQIACYNPHLDLVNIKVYTKFGQIMSICFEDIERKRNSDIIQAGISLDF